MTQMIIEEAIAGEPLEPGRFVRVEDGRAFHDVSLAGPGGVVRRTGGEKQFRKGQQVSLTSEGGILMHVEVAITVKIRGTPIRWIEGDQPYVYLERGRVVGFQGDQHLCL